MKKGTINPIITMAILGFFLVIFILAFFGRGLLPKAAEAGEKIADDIIEDLRTQRGDISPIPVDQDVLIFYDNLVNILNIKEEGPCLLNHIQPPKDFNGFKITLKELNQGSSIKILDKNNRFARTETVQSQPCVVGETDTVRNFFSNHLSSNKCEDDNCPQDYDIVDIEFRDAENIYININNKRVLENDNLLVRSRDGNVCFFTAKALLITQINEEINFC